MTPPGALAGVRRTATRALLLLGGAFLALAVANSFDEELSPEAAAYLAAEGVAVPDARNAYLAMLGFEAAPGTRPHEAGRRRLDEMATAIAADPLRVDVPPFRVERPLAASGHFGGCRGLSSCLHDVASGESALRLVEENGPLLLRYRELLEYPGFADAIPPSAFGSVPMYPALLAQARQLFHVDIALRLLQSGEPASRALADLARQIEFDRRNLAAAGHSLSKLVFAAQLRDDYLMLSEALQAAHSRGLQGGAGIVRAALAPLSQPEKSLAKVLRSEGRQSAATLRWLRPAMMRFRNPHAEIAAASPDLEIRSPFPSHSRAVNFLLAWLYQPNAAINEWFRMHRPVAALASASTKERIEAASGSDKWIRDHGEVSAPGPLNPVGIPAARALVLPGHVLSYSFFLDDLDGLVRLVALKAEVLSAGVPPSRLESHIALRQDLRNVYTGAPMNHHPREWKSGPVLVDLWFEPANPSWRQRDFGLGPGKVAVTVALPAPAR